jgi:hypothetical protein
MDFKRRKLFVWLISLGAVFAVYLLVNMFSGTPRIKIDNTTGQYVEPAAEFDDSVGKVGEVGVGTVKTARFTNFNKQKQLEREFGFEKLLHVEGNQWEIEKPYMNIFRSSFNGYIKADTGTVQVEQGIAGGRPDLRGGTLTGNVVIHILPQDRSKIQESFIYLDDIIFISDRSQFSTAGPVKFVSENARLSGRGLELTYNEQLDRVEELRIIHLDSLNLKTTPQSSAVSQAAAGGVRKTSQPAQQQNSRQIEQEQGRGYRCLFSKNVVINAPRQLILADQLFINNILRPKASQDDTDISQQVTAGPSDASARAENAVTHTEPNELPGEQLVDIVVTCDDGIVVTPMALPQAYSGFVRLGSEASGAGRAAAGFGTGGNRTTFAARRIDYDAVGGGTVASGPSQLIFGADIKAGQAAEQTTVPVKVTSQEKAVFLPVSDEVIFEGNCVCTAEVPTDSDARQRYKLSAPRLTVDLSRSETDRFSAAGLRHITGNGGIVKFAAVKTGQGRLIAGVELKCQKFDYDSAERIFTAAGPGLIKVDNSNIAPRRSGLGRISLQRPCYALMRNFDSLRYLLDDNKVIASGASHNIDIDYFPLFDGQYSQQITASAADIEADLIKTAAGRAELSTLSAAGGVTYNDDDVQFTGSDFFYDADSSLVTAWGGGQQVCYLNGAAVDGIEYDLKSGNAKAKIVGPGALP